MSKTHFFAALLLLALAVPALAATPAVLQAAQNADQSPTMPGGKFTAGKGKAGKLGGLLTPQQKAAFVLQARDETRNMTQDQRKAWRKGETRKLLSMSTGDRQKFVGTLQARWDALPERQKAKLNQRLAAKGQ
jgi:hypothetical protein